MGGIFGQVVTAFQGLLSRGFWFGSFLPVAVFGALNALLSHILFPDKDLLKQIVGANWEWTAPVVAALIVFAYAIAPLVPLCRAFMDGRLLPDWLLELLRREPEMVKQRALEAVQASLRDLTATSMADAALTQARANGIATGAAAHPELLEPAAAAVRHLEASIARGKAPRVRAMQGVVDTVVAALDANDTTMLPELEELDSRMRDVIGAVRNEVATQYDRRTELYNSMPPVMRPTAVGNARFRSELYSQNVYSAGFDFIWSRVQSVVPENDGATKRIEAARALLDFSVLMLMLGIVLLAVWLPLLALYGNDTLVPFLLLGLAGPIVLRLIYQLVIEAQISLGEIAQVMVDRFRFEVLKVLHIKPPATLAAERELWATLSAIAHGDAPKADIVWTNPS